MTSSSTGATSTRKPVYPLAAAVVVLLQRSNDKAPHEWAALTRRLLLKAPDPEAVFKEIVRRLHTTSGSGSITTEFESRLKLLDQLDIDAVPALVAALDATKASLRRRIRAERRWEENRVRSWRFERKASVPL
jgi:hypothetical protein